MLRVIGTICAVGAFADRYISTGYGSPGTRFDSRCWVMVGSTDANRRHSSGRSGWQGCPPPNMQNFTRVTGTVILTRTATTYQVGTVSNLLAGVDPADLSQTFPRNPPRYSENRSSEHLLLPPIRFPVIMSARYGSRRRTNHAPGPTTLPIGATGQIGLYRIKSPSIT